MHCHCKLSSFVEGFNSFSFQIYPSEFGIQRMKDEEVNGPSELRDGNQNDTADSGDEQLGENDEEVLNYFPWQQNRSLSVELSSSENCVTLNLDRRRTAMGKENGETTTLLLP